MNRPVRLALSLGALAVGLCQAPAQAALWNWDYAGPGISAGGTFTTNDTPDGSGHYAVTGIGGQRNGVTITGLMPAGLSIPGNEPFAVDNLISAASPQLTGDGIGFAMADGTYANLFFASFLATPGYLEFFSAPPFVPGNPGIEDSELPVVFHAAMAVPVPEPAGWASLALCLAALAALRPRGRGTR